MSKWRSASISLVLAVFALASHAANAETYPGNECASAKLAATADRCGRVLRAWSIYDVTRNEWVREWLLGRADEKFTAEWTAAEDAAASQNVDCVDMTLSAAGTRSLMDAAIGGIVADVNEGLDVLGKRKHGICGARLLKQAAFKCQFFLRAESALIGDLAGDPYAAARDAKQAFSSALFSHGWNQAVKHECPTEATEAGVESAIDTLNDDVVSAITISPNVPDDEFLAITHPAVGAPGHEVAYEGDVLGPRCQDSSQYSFFVRRGSVNKLLMYYEGGGACWDSLTCGFPLCSQNVDPDDAADAQNGFGGGFGDLTNPANPFRDWNVVYVPYCSCDVHWGDAAVDYPATVIIPGLLEFPAKHVEHRGYDNAKLAEKWAREHFLNPSDIFVSGSSAGSYGATMHAIPLNEVYPASNISMLGDGGNGVITQEFVEEQFPNWGVGANLPDVPGIGDVPVEEQSVPSIVKAAAEYYPRANWAHYTTAFDGSTGGQTGFYHVMRNPDNILTWLSWWESSCAFNQVMRAQAYETAAEVAQANDNYRYYIATGTRHTGFGTDRVYSDTSGGVPKLVDWVNAMIGDTPEWTNVEASPSNLLFDGECSSGSDNPGASCGYDFQCPNGSCQGQDPRPLLPTPPFEISGADTIVNCGP